MTDSIPYHDFGGDPTTGRLIHFAHPNGYLPGCFQQMINPLLRHGRVLGIHQRPLWPSSQPSTVTDWHILADDLIRFFDQQGWQGVIGIGHSLGAVVTLFAALKQPELFRALVLIEPVFLPPALLAAIAAQPEAATQTSLVRSTRRRRQHWPDKQAAFDHFRAKPLFERWSNQSLWDYVNCGLEERDGQLHLVYPREWEAHIYSLPPTTVWDDIRCLTHPTLAIRGTESNTMGTASWQLWQERQPSATFVELTDAGHMVPMERPAAVADAVADYLSRLDL